MAIISTSSLKSSFSVGKRPTETDFVNLIDTLGGSSISGGGHTIQNEGTSLTQRTYLNFVGGGVIASDVSASDKTNVKIPGILVKYGGADLTQRNTFKFSGAGVSAADVSASSLTEITIAGGGGGGGFNIQFQAGGFYYPNTNPAPMDYASTTTSIIPRHRFDDATEEAVLQHFQIGNGIASTDSIVLAFYGFPVTANTANTANKVSFKFYHNAKKAGESWAGVMSSAVTGVVRCLDTQNNFDYFSCINTMATLGWEANDNVRLKFARAVVASSKLAGDWGLTTLIIRKK